MTICNMFTAYDLGVIWDQHKMQKITHKITTFINFFSKFKVQLICDSSAIHARIHNLKLYHI